MRGRSAAILAAVALVVSGVMLVPVGPVSGHASEPGPQSGSSSLYIAATGDYGYTPDTFEHVPTNTTITVTFVDNSTMFDGHSFTIIGKEGVQLPSDASQDEIDALAWGHQPSALLDLNVSDLGDRNVSSFRSPGPGWYEFVCTKPSHFQLGMYGFIAFGEKLPSNLTLPNRQGLGGSPLSFDAVDAALVVVVLLVVALGYFRIRQLRRRDRPTPRAPPERGGAGSTPTRDTGDDSARVPR